MNFLSKHKFFGCLLVATALSGCNLFRDKHIPAGGPCEYETNYYPAIVDSVIIVDTDMIDARFLISGHNLEQEHANSLYFSAAFGKHLSPKEADSLGIHKGAVFKYQVRDITEGTCNPHMEFLILEPYPDNPSIQFRKK